MPRVFPSVFPHALSSAGKATSYLSVLLVLLSVACGSISRKSPATDASSVDAASGGNGGNGGGGSGGARDAAPAADATTSESAPRDGATSDAPPSDAGTGGAAGSDARPNDGGASDSGAVDAAKEASACTAAPEVCNGKDDDCDGVIDDGCPLDQALISTSGTPMQGVVFGSITQAGTSSFAAPCPDGQQVIGFTGNAGSAIDALGIKCGILRVHEDRTTTPFGYNVTVEAGDTLPPQGGTGGVAQGIDGVLGCHVNEVVVGVEAWSLDVTGTCPADYCPSGAKTGCTEVTGLAVTCASYTIKGAPGSFALVLGAGRDSAVAGTGENAAHKSQKLACTAPAALHRLDGVKGPFVSNCTITVIQGVRGTCTTPTLALR